MRCSSSCRWPWQAGLTAQQAAPQKVFDTAQAAADALIKAAEANDTAALAEIFGAEGKELYASGDAVQDKNHLAAFAAKAREKMSVAADPKKSARAIADGGLRRLADARADREEQGEVALRLQGRAE